MEVLNVKNLNISLGEQNKLEDGSFIINTGDVVLLTGPNGCGKSTIIKLIMGDLFGYDNIKFSSDGIYFEKEHDILGSEAESEMFRKRVCYISQEDEFESDSVMDCFLMAINYDIKRNKEKYVFDFVKQYGIQNCFGIPDDVDIDSKGKRIARKIRLDASQMDPDAKKVFKYLSMSIKKMSGGQKKLTNIMTNLIRYDFSKLILLDEPLNNLDYGNVRSFSNVLTKIYRAKPELGIIIVTHCRSIPIVNRVLEINVDSRKIIETGNYTCNSCFGNINEQGFYL